MALNSLDLLADVIGWTKARGMRAHVHLIVGMPDESWETVRNTTRWLRRVKPEFGATRVFRPLSRDADVPEELRQSREAGDVEALDWNALDPSSTRSFLPGTLPATKFARPATAFR